MIHTWAAMSTWLAQAVFGAFWIERGYLTLWRVVSRLRLWRRLQAQTGMRSVAGQQQATAPLNLPKTPWEPLRTRPGLEACRLTLQLLSRRTVQRVTSSPTSFWPQQVLRCPDRDQVFPAIAFWPCLLSASASSVQTIVVLG